MRRNKFIYLAWVGLLVFTAACGGGGSGGGGDGGGAGPQPTSPVNPDTAATITGKVAFSGTPPENAAILMEAEPTCLEQHPGGVTEETVLVNNGALQNVFVYVKSGLGDLKFPVPSEEVVLDQLGCRYVPHVLGVQVGQTLVIRNSDGILHNIHPMPSANTGFNLGQPVKMESKRTFDKPEVMIPIECDVHDWMIGYLGVLEHPYYSVTGADGTFSLANLPPGTYTLEAWHEQYGTQTMEVTVGEKETKDVEFTFGG